MLDRPLSYLLPASLDAATLVARLRDAFLLTSDGPTDASRQYLDTFDARLYRAGDALHVEQAGPELTLRWETRQPPAIRYSLPVKALPRTADDLPPGAARSALARHITPRVLLPLLRLEGPTWRCRVLNREDKTVARLLITGPAKALLNETGASATLPGMIQILPLRGYLKASRKLVAFLEQIPGIEETGSHELDRACQALGVDPAARSGKLDLALDPDERADRAVRRILLHLLDVMQRNEPGLRANLDPEFLHDYRVALRRTRTILGQLKGCFPPEPLAHFREAFRWLGQLTGPVRDLDVYLLRMDAYRAALPEHVRPHLDPLQAFLAQRQRAAHREMVAAMETSRYTALMDAWRAFLEGPVPEPPPTPEAATPIHRVASRRIWRAYRRVRRQGRAITPTSPAAALHTLRIACKKLRYLLEIFRNLYPPRPMKRLIGELKKLQDVLGDFQDFAVQQEALQGFAREMAAAGMAPPETLTAMGRLEAHLSDRQTAARDAFALRFGRFVRPKNHRRFVRLFKQAPVDPPDLTPL